MSLCKGFTQGGSNADSLLSDSFVKGISAGIDWETGYQAVVNDATKEGDFSVQGRGGIAARQQHGYIPVRDTEDNPPNEGPNTRFVMICYLAKKCANLIPLLGARADF